jgi:hypothetical protein
MMMNVPTFRFVVLYTGIFVISSACAFAALLPAEANGAYLRGSSSLCSVESSDDTFSIDSGDLTFDGTGVVTAVCPFVEFNLSDPLIFAVDDAVQPIEIA